MKEIKSLKEQIEQRKCPYCDNVIEYVTLYKPHKTTQGFCEHCQKYIVYHHSFKAILV